MSREIIKGDELQLFINNGAPKFATSHTLTLSGSTLDIATKDHGFWGANEVGKVTWELTAECLYTDGDYDTMFDLMIAHSPINITFAKVRNYSVNGLTSVGGDTAAWIPDVIQRKGPAYVTSLTANANTGENATYSITFTGAGALKFIDNRQTNYFIDVTYNSSPLAVNTTLYNVNTYYLINSCYVYDNNGQSGRPTLTEIDISTGKLTSAAADVIRSMAHPTFRYHLGGNTVPLRMFYNINTIDTVTLNSYMTEIDSYCFAESSIVTLNTETQNGVKYKNHCFNNCLMLTNINNSHNENYLNAKQIANSAFAGCVRLANIHTGDACEYVLAYGFADCMALIDVHFGYSLTRVGDYAFSKSSHATVVDINFYTEKAPICEEHSYGNIGYQAFILHNASAVEDFLQDTDMARFYPVAQCDYNIAN